MEYGKWILNKEANNYFQTVKKLPERIDIISSFISDGSSADTLKMDIEDCLSKKIDSFSTNKCDVDRVDERHVILRYAFWFFEDDENAINAYENSGVVIDRRQLYYLIDEWWRLSEARINTITITYENGVYAIEGE